MNQRTFLGLSHNPFIPPREGFFNGGDRKTHLDHLRHLSQWSRRVLVVTGPYGIGKSSMFRALSGSLEDTAKAARLSGTVVTTERETLVSLLQGFGIAADPDAHTEDLAELIVRHADEQESHGRICMAMVDDAHLLEVQAIHRLVSMVATSSLRVLFFAEESFVDDLNRTATLHDLEWFEIRLTGLPKADVREYLEWRFRQAHYRGLLPFTDEQVQKIVARSSGNPSMVDSMANDLLAEMEAGESGSRGAVFPLAHATLVVLLVAMIGLVYLFVQDDKDSQTQESVEQELAQEITEDYGAPPSFANEDAKPNSVSETMDDVPVTAVAADMVEVAADQEVIPPAILSKPNAEEVSVPDDPPVVEPETAASSPTTEPVAQEVVPIVESTPEEVVAPVTPPKKDSIVKETVPQSGAKTAQWLLRQDSERFTLQLLTLSQLDNAQRFVARQENTEEFALYRMQRDSKTMYVITYGVFTSRAAAQAAGERFTGELAKLKPWIRPLSLVQDTIRGTQQE